MPLPDPVAHRLIQARHLLAGDPTFAMENQVRGPATEPPTNVHPDHAEVLQAADGFVLGAVRLNDGPWLPDWNPFAELAPDQDPPPATWYVVGDVADVGLLVLNEDDAQIVAEAWRTTC